MSDSASTGARDDLFWRDEVLEATYWMLGEGIEEAVAPADLDLLRAVRSLDPCMVCAGH